MPWPWRWPPRPPAAPAAGRLADRCPGRLVLGGFLCAHAAAYGLLLAALAARPPTAALVTATELLGATTPPASPVIRAAWPRLVRGDTLRTAYTIDSAATELTFVVGPLAVSALLPVLSARTIVACAGAAFLLGVLALIASGVTAPSGPPASRPGRRGRIARLTGPLAHPPTLLLLIVAACATFGYGCLRVAAVASATHFGSTASAGVLMGLLSAGTLIGGLTYGARTWPGSGRRRLIILCTADTAILSADAAAPRLAVLALLIAVTGLLSGPRDTLQPVLLTEQAPAEHHTEVFAWLNTFMWSGYGLGTAVAGHLTGPADNGTAAYAAAAAIALLAAVLATLLYRPAAPPTPELSQETG